MNFNNLDGYALIYTNPTRSSLHPDVTLNYYGGPGAEDRLASRSSRVYTPVVRSSRRPSVSVRVSSGNVDVCGAINGAVPFSRETFTAATPGGTLPPPVIRGVISSAFARNVVGNSSQPSTLNNGVIECGGYEAPQTTASNIPAVVAAIDNQNNPAPRVTFANGYASRRRSASRCKPPSDYQGPMVRSRISVAWVPPRQARGTAASDWLVNSTFNFTPRPFVAGLRRRHGQRPHGQLHGLAAPRRPHRGPVGHGCGHPGVRLGSPWRLRHQRHAAGFYGISPPCPYRLLL